MEALGIAVNVIAVVDLVAKVCEAIYKYANTAKNCPQMLELLQREVSAAQKSLNGLRAIADELDAAANASEPVVSQLSTELNDCRFTLEMLMKELDGHLSNKLREKVGRRLKWPMEEVEVMDIIPHLGRYQQTFQQALQTDMA